MPFVQHVIPFVSKAYTVVACSHLGAVLFNVTNSTNPFLVVKNVTATIALASYPVTPTSACKLALLGAGVCIRVVIPKEEVTPVSIRFVTQVIRSYYP